MMNDNPQELTLRDRRLAVLQRVASGELNPDEGALLLKAFDHMEDRNTGEAPETVFQPMEDEDHWQAGPVIQPDLPVDGGPGPEFGQDTARWKRWWVLPLGVGAFITIVGALLMYWGYSRAGMSWGFWLSWIPLGLGLLLMALAWWSQTARWLHVRIRQKPGESPSTIAISMPLPLHFAGWFFKVFGRFIPDVKGQPVGEIVTAFEQAISPDSPFYVKVDDDEDGETVEVYIG